MDSFDWEVRHQSTPFHVHLIAGSLAGVSEHLSMLPLDNIKTHCQAGQNLSIFKIVNKIYKNGGLKNFYSGSSVLTTGCIPAHGMYFSIYQLTKSKLGLNHNSHHQSYLYTIVGACSSLFHDFILTPTEAIKQRLQLLRSESPKISAFQVVKGMYKQEGIKSFYRSFGINYFMNVPFGALIVTLNETLKDNLFSQNVQQNLVNYYLCAGFAGFLASIPTSPLDVIKTKLNTQDCLKKMCSKDSICKILNGTMVNHQNKVMHNHATHKFRHSQAISTQKDCVKYPNVRETIRLIFKEEGFLGFFKGLKMRILIQAPSSAISWGTYQTLKRWMVKPHH